MVKALSLDLRTRVLAAVAEGASHRAAAGRVAKVVEMGGRRNLRVT